MKVGVIVQARMSSERFPGKVLYEVAGKPLLQYLIERLQHCPRLDAIVVATSTDESDTPIEGFCREYGLACYRGALLNVAGRFKELLDQYQFDAFVRLSGDSPLLDQRLVEQGVDIFLNGDYDLVTNVLVRTYPKGQSVEILRSETFKLAYPAMQDEEAQEHVTKYFYQHQANFKIFNFAAARNYDQLQLSVDTPQDMQTCASIISHMNSKPHWEYTLDDILHLYYILPRG